MDIKSREFAKKLGFAPQSVSSWKNRTKIPKYIIKTIANTFNVSEQWLETGEGPVFREVLAIHESQAPYGNNERSFNVYQIILARANKAGLDEEERKKLGQIIARIGTLLTIEDRQERERYAAIIYGVLTLCQSVLSQQGGRAIEEPSFPLEQKGDK